MKNKKISVVVVDDHPYIRAGIRSIIDNQDDMYVVAEAENGEEAIKCINKLAPDVAIIDFEMPILSGPECTKILSKISKTKVITLSAFSSLSHLKQMIKAGAQGYLLKENPAAEIAVAVRTVFGGKHYFDSHLNQLITKDYQGLMGKNDSSPLAKLTKKERIVLKLIASGTSTRSISQELNITVHTVASHRAHILERLEIDNIADLIKFAIREGLTNLDID